MCLDTGYPPAAAPAQQVHHEAGGLLRHDGARLGQLLYARHAAGHAVAARQHGG